MKTLLWKELRENLKWALLGLLAAGGSLLYGLFHTNYGTMDFSSYNGVTLLRREFLLATTFVFPAVGLFLGLVQILPEQKRDRWAALLHRPIPPEQVLLGKLLAGFVLYAFSVVTPFLGAVWIAATPGNFAAPFVSGMALAGFADLMVGFTYYLAAFCMVLPRTGWAQRILPLLAAVDLSSLAQDADLFRVAAGSSFAMGLGMYLTARGMIREPASFSQRSLISRLALLAIAFFGICGAAGLGRAFLDAAVPAPRRVWVNYEFTKNGNPILLTYTNGAVTKVSDAQGQPIGDPKLTGGQVRNHVLSLNPVSNFIGDSHGWKPRQWTPSYRETSLYLWVGTSYVFPRPEQWFGFLPSKSWICYGTKDNLPVARFDAGGFKPPEAIPEPLADNVQFEELSSERILLWTESTARMVDLNLRQIRELNLPAAPPLYGVNNVSASTPTGSVFVTAIALESGIAVFNHEQKVLVLLPYTQDVSQWGKISLGINSELDRYFLVYKPSSWIEQKIAGSMPSFFEVVDSRGQVIQSTRLEPLPPIIRSVPVSRWLTERLNSPALFLGELAYRKIGSLLGSARLEKSLRSQLVDRWPHTRELMSWILGVSALCALMAFWLGRRSNRDARSLMAWTLIVFAFNIAGLLLFRLVADWPKQVKCPACSALRPLGKPTCPHCGDRWKTPEPAGFDILRPETPDSPALNQSSQ